MCFLKETLERKKILLLFLNRWTRPPEPDERTDGDDDDQNYNEIDENGGEEVDDGEESELRRRLHDVERSE